MSVVSQVTRMSGKTILQKSKVEIICDLYMYLLPNVPSYTDDLLYIHQ